MPASGGLLTGVQVESGFRGVASGLVAGLEVGCGGVGWVGVLRLVGVQRRGDGGVSVVRGACLGFCSSGACWFHCRVFTSWGGGVARRGLVGGHGSSGGPSASSWRRGRVSGGCCSSWLWVRPRSKVFGLPTSVSSGLRFRNRVRGIRPLVLVRGSLWRRWWGSRRVERWLGMKLPEID